MEESAFILCQNHLGTSLEAEACTDWIAESVCRSTYLLRLEQVAKFTSTEKLRQYREAAEKRLPTTCEPMSAVILNLDILKSIPPEDQKTRFKRWQRIFTWADKLAPNQRQILAAEAADTPEFASLLAQNNTQKHLLKAGAESANMLPDISEQTLFFLHQLEEVRPDLMTPEMHAVLLSDELSKSQYKMAASRLDIVDVTRLSTDHKNRLMPIIANAAVQLLGKADISQAICIQEAPNTQYQLPKQTLLEALDLPKIKGLIAGHFIAKALIQCDGEEIGKRMAELWTHYPTDPNLHALTQALLANLETHHNVQISLHIAEQLHDLPPQSLETFRKSYGAKLTLPIYEAALFALNTANPTWTRRALEAIAKLLPSSRENERLLYLGRAYAALKDETKARQIWAQIIDQSPDSSWGRQAMQMSVLSFQRSGKKAEAQALMQQYGDR